MAQFETIKLAGYAVQSACIQSESLRNAVDY